MKYAICVQNVSKTYRSQGQVVEAVKNVSLNIPTGTIVSLLGPNGSGKTTLIKSMCGLVYPDEGDVFILGHSITKNRKQALHSLGCILEGERNIYYYLTVYDNLFYFGTLNRIPKNELNRRINDLLHLLGLEKKRNAYAGDLSRGMQQKLALGIVLLKDPDVLLLDEPTLGLDVQASHDLLLMIQDMAKQGKTIILTTHQLELAERVSDYIILFQEGQVLMYELKSKLLKSFNHEIQVGIMVHPDDQEKMRSLSGIEQNEDGSWILPLEVFEEMMMEMKINKIRILDLHKHEKSLEQIFLEIVGDKDGNVVRPTGGIS
jgi:ABC-2 type transport system ATP-binding protein